VEAVNALYPCFIRSYLREEFDTTMFCSLEASLSVWLTSKKLLSRNSESSFEICYSHVQFNS